MNEQPVDQLMRSDAQDLVVEEGTEVRLDAANARLTHARRVVTIRRFEDLQSLSLVPRWLSEGDLNEAVTGDSAEALEVARQTLGSSLGGCGCGSCEDAASNQPLKVTFGERLHRVHVGIRKTYHPRLATLMSQRSQSLYHHDDLHVSIVAGWYTNWKAKLLILFPIWLWKDITIGKNATLVLGPAEKGLYCGDLRIHTGGKLVVTGAGVKLRCHSAQGDIP